MLVGVVIVAGIAVLRFSRASAGSAPKGPVYWLGDSLTTGLVVDGGLAQKLQNNGYSPAFINQDPGRSISKGGFGQQSALVAVDANNTNVCGSEQTKSNATMNNYCQANGGVYNPVKDAKTIVIFLGTNPETGDTKCSANGKPCDNLAEPSIFANAQKQLIQKIRAINPSAQIDWVDVAAPGNKALSYQSEMYFRRNDFPSQEAFDQWFANNYTVGRQRLQNTLNTIYNQSAALNYNLISQFKFLWGNDASNNGIILTTDQKDANKNLSDDGVHYLASGSAKLADYLLNSLNNGTFAPGLVDGIAKKFSPVVRPQPRPVAQTPSVACQDLKIEPVTVGGGQALKMTATAKQVGSLNPNELADFSFYLRAKKPDGTYDDTTVDAKGRHEIQAWGNSPDASGVYTVVRPPQVDPAGTFIMPANTTGQNQTYQVFLRIFWRGHNIVSDAFSVPACAKEINVRPPFKRTNQ